MVHGHILGLHWSNGNVKTKKPSQRYITQRLKADGVPLKRQKPRLQPRLDLCEGRGQGIQPILLPAPPACIPFRTWVLETSKTSNTATPKLRVLAQTATLSGHVPM